MKRVLFVCGRNRKRSSTAEAIFSERANLEVSSAGLNSDADTVLDAQTVREAEIIFVMEKSQRIKLQKRFRSFLKNQRVICLDIADEYEFMEPALIEVLHAKAEQFLI